MTFSKTQAEVFVPQGGDAAQALERATDLCISAHQDDIEIMAYGPIAACYDDGTRFFAGCVVGDGGGAPRAGLYAGYTDEDMKAVRVKEQKTAATIGNYTAQVFLQHASSDIKEAGNSGVVDDIEALLAATRPHNLYTHNLADKHDTHVAVALRTIEAVRRLPQAVRPRKIYAMEVWRGLDWLCDGDKALFDTSPHPGLAAALLGVFDSQVAGGKRYDSAALGRRLANATFFASHQTDSWESMGYGMDITDQVYDGNLSPAQMIQSYLARFSAEVIGRVTRLGGA